MEERKIGLIPRLMVSGIGGQREFGLLLTDRRMIFVMVRSSKTVLAGAAFGIIGAAVAEAAARELSVDFANTSPEAFACDKENICIPYSSLEELRMKRQLGGGHQLQMRYAPREGKSRKLTAFLLVPEDLEAQKRQMGVRSKDISEEYARKSQEALRKALPVGAQQNVEWLE